MTIASTYGSNSIAGLSNGGETVFGLGAEQRRQAMNMLGQSAEAEARRNLHNDQLEQERKAGNSQLGSAVGGAAAGAAFGPWGSLIGGALGAIAGHQF